ncbi:STAS domain-containing protein [Streptomyces sp. SID14478]|nr:STAS domain-containing protein [Streptomyces sp. SID14478]
MSTNDEQGWLRVTQTCRSGVTVITVRGEIDHDTAGPLRLALSAAGDEAVPRVVVDLSGVTFMDSSGLNTFLTAYARFSEAGGWLRLAGPQGSPLRTLRLLGMATVLRCSATVDEALAE